MSTVGAKIRRSANEEQAARRIYRRHHQRSHLLKRLRACMARMVSASSGAARADGSRGSRCRWSRMALWKRVNGHLRPSGSSQRGPDAQRAGPGPVDTPAHWSCLCSLRGWRTHLSRAEPALRVIRSPGWPSPRGSIGLAAWTRGANKGRKLTTQRQLRSWEARPQRWADQKDLGVLP